MRATMLMIGLLAGPVMATPIQGPPRLGERVRPPLPEGPPLVADRVRIERERQELVDAPIRAGRKSGQLSRSEARGMRKSSTVLAETADRYAADGRLSDAERAELDGRTRAMQGYVNAQRSLPPDKRR